MDLHLKLEPLLGSLSAQCEQDFWDGAGTAFPLYPAASPQQNVSSSPYNGLDYMETKVFGFDGIEAFNDVILSNSPQFEPEISFSEFQSNDISLPASSLLGISANTLFFGEPSMSLNYPSFEHNTSENLLPVLQLDDLQETLYNGEKAPIIKSPRITIKLKRVKANCTSLQHPLYNLATEAQDGMECVIETIESSSPSHCSPPPQNVVQIGSPEPFLTQIGSPEPSLTQIGSPEPSLTLKDALNMDDASNLLESLFDQDSDYDSSVSSTGSPVHSISLASSPQSLFQEESLFEEIPQSKSDCRKSRKSKPRISGNHVIRYERKKEQNKQAALKYRLKKRQEDDDLFGVLEKEQQTQKELKKKYANLKQELRFMKKLMREAFIIKGLVSADTLKRTKNS